MRFSKTWGERKDIEPPSVAVLPELIQSLQQKRNWVASVPRNRFSLVNLKEVDPEAEEIVIESSGGLTISQNKMPLQITIEKYGASTPNDISSARIRSVRIEEQETILDDVRDNFAPSSFVEMSDDDKLKAPSYVQERSGVSVRETDEIRVSHATSRKVIYEVRSTDFDREGDTPIELFEPLQLPTLVERQNRLDLAYRGGAAARSALARDLRKTTRAPRVLVGEDAYAIAGVTDLNRVTPGEFSAGTRAEANDQLRRFVAQNPKLKDQLQVVAEYQLAS